MLGHRGAAVQVIHGKVLRHSRPQLTLSGRPRTIGDPVRCCRYVDCRQPNAHQGQEPTASLENPSGCAMARWRPCRIGSAELLQSERKRRIVALRALLRAADAAPTDWGSGDLFVSAAHARSLSAARDKPRAILGSSTAPERPSVLITVGRGVAYLVELVGDVDSYILDYDDLRVVPQDKRKEVLANLSEKERAYLREHPT